MDVLDFQEIAPPCSRGNFLEIQNFHEMAPVILLRNTSGQPPVVHSYPSRARTLLSYRGIYRFSEVTQK